MFLPLGDTPNPPGRPWLTWTLVGINVAVFLLISLPAEYRTVDLSDPLLMDYLRSVGARGRIPVQAVQEQVSAYDLFLFRYGYRPWAPTFTSLFSAMFLHAGWLHLGGNMLFLWIFGDNVEYRLGRLNFLLAYISTGICSTLFFGIFSGGPEVTLVGASGAISGVLGLYFFWFPRNRIRTFVFLFPFVMGTYLLPSRLILGFYLIADNLLPFLIDRAGSGGVAHGAHIGGFVAGLVLAYAIDRASGWSFLAEEKRLGKAMGEKAGDLAEALERGDVRSAARLYFSLPGRSERIRFQSRDLIALGEALLEEGRCGQALPVFRRFISERPADCLYGRACLGAGKAMMGLERRTTSAFQYFLSALDAPGSPEVAEEARKYLSRIEWAGRRADRQE